MAALAGFALAVCLSFGVESRARPYSAPFGRQPWLARLLHGLASAQIYTLLLALTGRVAFSTLLSIALAALVVFVSNAKYRALQEPLVFSDIHLLRQLLRYPRLYLPFVGNSSWWRSASVLGLLVLGLALDRPQSLHWRLGAVLVLTLVSLGMFVLARRLRLQLQPAADLAAVGFFASFYAGLLQSLGPATPRQLAQAMAAGPFAAPAPATAPAAAAPDVILIQSESFFDARRLGPEVRPELLRHFDRARREALAWGDLQVPAYGANTMRSEFAVLSGLSVAAQGLAGYYPYAYIRQTMPSLAGWYRQQGYATCFIHPYHSDFFGRDRVMPYLQFQRFVDIRAFDRADYAGPYVGDHAVLERIMDQLGQAEVSGQPALVMAVTMENHGPLHLEQVSAGEANRYHGFGEGERLDDLTAYLRHLVHADEMIGALLDSLSRRQRPAVVCFYGDHVPALPDLFARLGKPQAATDYFLWHSAGGGGTQRRNLNAADLGRMLVQASAAPRSL